jgi:hypothetical protein
MPATATGAVSREGNRMNLIKATGLDSKSGGAQWRSLCGFSFLKMFFRHSVARTCGSASAHHQPLFSNKFVISKSAGNSEIQHAVRTRTDPGFRRPGFLRPAFLLPGDDDKPAHSSIDVAKLAMTS